MLPAAYYLIPALLLSQLAAVNSVYFSAILASFSYCPADMNAPWSYRGQNGPAFWGENNPDCNNDKQSPININTTTVVQDATLGKLFMNNYDIPVTKASIQNNGRTVMLTPHDNVERSIIIGGSTYSLKQLHFHWGSAFFRGSEHTLDLIQYALEMHLVHMNENNEIAVVSAIFQEGQSANNDLQYVVDALPEVMYKDDETELYGNFNLNNLLPENPASYYRYSGSLTTPECSEGVTWSVLTSLLSVGTTQMNKFRDLYSAPWGQAKEGCKLSDNYRPIQPLNYRIVYVSE